MENVDWRLAQRVGEMVAGSPVPGSASISAPAMPVSEMTALITHYTGMALQRQPPPLELVDRPRWIAANLRSMRPLLDPLTERLGGGLGPFSGALRSASSFLVGIQVGALTGVLSQRVLGQYDLALLDESVPPRLLLVTPNLAQAARNLSVDREELVSWVTIHEVTHAVQFGSAPWLRAHLAGILGELIASMQVSVSGNGEHGLGLGSGLDFRDFTALRGQLNDLIARARSGELLKITLGEERWQLVEKMQSAMSLIEGHAEHVMDVVGAELLPSLPRLREAMTRRRQHRPLPWRVIERLLGLELKMRQYEVGRKFCDAVVAAGGPHALAPAWSSVEGLPSAKELEQPQLWLARMG